MEFLTNSSAMIDELGNIATEPCIIKNLPVKEETNLRQRSGLNETFSTSTNPLSGGLSVGKNLFEMDSQFHNGKTNEEHTKNINSGLLVLLAITSITLLFTGFGLFLGHVRCLNGLISKPILIFIFCYRMF